MNEIGIGVIAVAVASSMLLLAVARELAPAGGLTGRGRWLLAAGLGAGLITFAFKLVVIALSMAAPPTMFHAEFKAQPIERAGGLADVGVPVQRHRWEPLPRTAPTPADNPTTPAKVALGRMLFFDTNLSSTREIACASCHDLFERGGADGRRVARGVEGLTGERNAPTVWNAAFQARLFWDGRAASLEEQAKGPFVNAREMGMPSLEAVVDRVQAQPAYGAAFAAAFADDAPITAERVAQAIAAFERTLLTPDTPYDRFARGDDEALTSRQLRGMALFEAFGCVQCHAGPNFSAASLFDTQAPMRAFPALPTQGLEGLELARDPGLASASAGGGVWRVPSLRNVALTPPYFHNGSVERLDEAVRIMLRAQLGVLVDGPFPPAPRVARAPGQYLELRTPVVASRDDVQAIVAFLESLSGDLPALRKASQARWAESGGSSRTLERSRATPRTPDDGSGSAAGRGAGTGSNLGRAAGRTRAGTERKPRSNRSDERERFGTTRCLRDTHGRGLSTDADRGHSSHHQAHRRAGTQFQQGPRREAMGSWDER